MLARAWLAYPQLRVLPSLPVNSQDYFAGLLINVGDNVGNQGSHKLLACAHCCTGGIPRRLKIFGKPREVWSSCAVRSRRTYCIKSHLASLDTAQCGFPALLQLSSNQAVIWVAGSIAPFGKPGFIACLLQFQLYNTLLFVLSLHMHTLGLQGCFDSHRLHSAN